MAKSRKALASHEELDKFDQFVFEMDDVLDEFLRDAEKSGYRLDYTMESLAELERLILEQLNLDMDASQRSRFENRAARYLGEVFRKRWGGKWELCLKSPRYLFFKLPVITGYSSHPIEFCPIETLKNFEVGKTTGLLRRAVEAHAVE